MGYIIVTNNRISLGIFLCTSNIYYFNRIYSE